MTAFGSLEAAVSAIRAGAFDFVTKPLDMEILDIALRRAVYYSRLRQQVNQLQDAVDQLNPFGELLGESPVMQSLYKQLRRVAGFDTTVLITGESGTGKELAANSIHQKSSVATNRLLRSTGALPEALMESELFGHMPGAFTGADKKHDGLFVRANGGTLFLDEIGEMSLAMQPKLLRAWRKVAFARSAAAKRFLSMRAWLLRPIAICRPRSKRDVFAKIFFIDSMSCRSTCRRFGREARTSCYWHNTLFTTFPARRRWR